MNYTIVSYSYCDHSIDEQTIHYTKYVNDS